MRLATRFVAAVAASPFGIPPCPGRQVGEGNCPAQDATPTIAQVHRIFKSNNELTDSAPLELREAHKRFCGSRYQ